MSASERRFDIFAGMIASLEVDELDDPELTLREIVTVAEAMIGHGVVVGNGKHTDQLRIVADLLGLEVRVVTVQ